MPAREAVGAAMADVVYREAVGSDVEMIQAAAAASWRATYKTIFSAEFITEFLARDYSTGNLTQAIRDKGSIFLVAERAGRVIGYCHYADGPEGPQLVRMYVVPEAWRCGVGSRFLSLLEARLVDRGLSRYFCLVHERNEIAQAFYRQHGFARRPNLDRDYHWYLIKHLES